MDTLISSICKLQLCYQFYRTLCRIHLASISKRLKAIIATMERRLKEPTELHFCINFRRRFIGINLEKSSEKNIRSRYFIIEYDTVMPGEWCIERSIYGRTWRIDDSVRGGWTIEKSPEAVLSWLKYFKELFNCRLVLLLTLSQNDSYFEPLFVESDLLHVADKIINNYHGVMSTPRMAFILDTFHANYLEITAKVERDFTYDKPLTRLGMLSLCYAPWLSMEKVWKMIEGGICRQMSFPFNQNWKEEDINEFLKNWLDSDNTTFETLNLKADDSMRRISIDVILNGITTTPGCKKRQDAAE